jgi:uncharacterized protein
MKIDITQIRQAIGACQSFSFLCSVNDLQGDDQSFWLNGDIEVQGKIVNSGRFLDLSGTVKGKARKTCDRCLKEFDFTVETSFLEHYRECDEKTSHTEDDDAQCIQGDEIDISEVVRDNLIMAEPIKTVCWEDCRGLCPKCGVDLNITKCSCEHEDIDPRLAALKALLNK